MKYEQFVCATKEKVELMVGKDMRVEFHTALKNNGKEKIGLAIKDEKVNITPVIYLEEYFEIYESGDTIHNIAQSIITIYDKVRLYDSWNTEDYLEYSKIKNTLACKLINYEANKKLLKEVPHIKYLDLAIVFYNLVHGSMEGSTTMLLKTEHMKSWGVSIEKLYKETLSNTVKMLPAKFENMNSVINELLDECEIEKLDEQPIRMYVLSNEIRNFGASCILYPEELKRIGTIIGGNYYILPSSIHEVIVMPEKIAPSREELKELIQGVNIEAVEEEEILSDHPYYYDCEKKTLLY